MFWTLSNISSESTSSIIKAKTFPKLQRGCSLKNWFLSENILLYSVTSMSWFTSSHQHHFQLFFCQWKVSDKCVCATGPSNSRQAEIATSWGIWKLKSQLFSSVAVNGAKGGASVGLQVATNAHTNENTWCVLRFVQLRLCVVVPYYIMLWWNLLYSFRHFF